MKLKAKKLGIASSIAVTNLMHPACGQVESGDFGKVVEVNSIQAIQHKVVVSDMETLDENAMPSTWKVSIPDKHLWDDEAKMRFRELAGKFAIEGALSDEEDIEYSTLKRIRRREEQSRSYDEMVRDIELHRKVSEAINSLKSLIDYATSTFPAETHENRV